jgi:RNA polymerase sigma-70 factor, ECF subfamily
LEECRPGHFSDFFAITRTEHPSRTLGPSGSFGYGENVFSVNPAFVELEPSEAQTLLGRAIAGEAEAFGELCRVYETRLLRQALTLCGNATLAEDLAQDTLVEAWKFLSRYNGQCQFFTWLCAILINRYRNSRREKRLIPFLSLATSDGEQASVEKLADQVSSPDQATQLREQAALILQCVEALPRKQQQVIYLRFYVDDSLEGIAAALGCSVGTVKSRLFRALDKLRTMNALRAVNVEMKVGSL